MNIAEIIQTFGEFNLETAPPYRVESLKEIERYKYEIFTPANIALHHANTRRWNGQFGKYNDAPKLAQHVLVMAQVIGGMTHLPEDLRVTAKLFALVHDAEEMLTGDVPSTVKYMIVKPDVLKAIGDMVISVFFAEEIPQTVIDLVKTIDDYSWRAESQVLHGKTWANKHFADERFYQEVLELTELSMARNSVTRSDLKKEIEQTLRKYDDIIKSRKSA